MQEVQGDTVRQVLVHGHELWERLKANWYNLGLPGSSYSSDIPIWLLLANCTTFEEAADALRRGQEMLGQLQQNGHAVFLMGSDVTNALLLDLAELQHAVPDGNAIEEPPQPPPEPVAVQPMVLAEPAPVVTGCPHCNHDFATCARGEYFNRSAKLDLAHASLQLEVDQLRNQLKTAEQKAAQPPVATEQPRGCEHVGTDGKCTMCTNDETGGCCGSGCDEDVVISHAIKCKNFDECGNFYCSSCAEDELNGEGYCESCNNIECHECGEELERGTEHVCKNPDCPNKNFYCDNCAKQLLTEAGLCGPCAKEDSDWCSDCESDTLKSRLKKCADEDCENVYCPLCVESNLNRRGLCGDCR